jgi:ABC-type bacteriocin/lantibiotic exporter with double-glycine peptidase domain
VKIRANAPALDAIIDDLRKARWRSRATKPIDDHWHGRPHHSIALSGVAFRYDASLPWVLSNVTMRIPAGSITAFLGRNGAGKTALADVLLGLLIPEVGTLAVDDEPINDSNRFAWQSVIAYVPQQIFLLDASIAENIAFGSAGSDIDATRLEEAVRLARLRDFAATLPAGLETIIGERGIRLSGGMRQRVGIARALYRQSTVLVLDEATNALDAPTENEMVDVLRDLRGARTIIVIAHGHNVVRIADLAYEVRNGSVALCANQNTACDAAIRAS